jgi:hypothetical protein
MTNEDARYNYDVTTDPSAIEPVEHRIRLDFMAGGPIRRDQLLSNYTVRPSESHESDPWSRAGNQKPLGLQFAEETCLRHLEAEQSYYDSFEDDEVLVDAPAYLAYRLRQCRSADDPDKALQKERTRRENWYRTLIPQFNLSQVLRTSSYGSLITNISASAPDSDALTTQNAFVGMVILADAQRPDTFARERGLPVEYVVRERDLSTAQSEAAATPSDFGISLPAPLLVGKYASGSRYPWLPWSDGLVCSCPYKQGKPWRVLCKHELLAAVILGGEESFFLPVTEGLDVPHRARRFVSPAPASSRVGYDSHRK